MALCLGLGGECVSVDLHIAFHTYESPVGTPRSGYRADDKRNYFERDSPAWVTPCVPPMKAKTKEEKRYRSDDESDGHAGLLDE
jgi:hypothetical protein